jgi:hypothetical protein
MVDLLEADFWTASSGVQCSGFESATTRRNKWST